MSVVYLVVARPELDGLLANGTHDRWRLPSIENPTRSTLADRIHGQLCQVLAADIVHWAPLPVAAQSKSRHGAEPWYCTAIARDVLAPADFQIVALDQLLSGDALEPTEQLAIRTALSRLQGPLARFDSNEEVQAALAWARHEIADRTGTTVLSTTPHRCGRHEWVARFVAPSGAMYLKAGLDRVADEAVLTQHLRALRPSQFAETLAVDELHARWLHREVPGVPLGHTSISRDQIVDAIRRLAALQKDALGTAAIHAHLTPRKVDAVGLFHRVDDIVQEAWSSAAAEIETGFPLAAWRSMRAAIVRVCENVDDLGVPSSLVLSDLWSENILVTPQGGFGFIDVGNSYWSYPFLSLWRYIRDVDRRRRTTEPIGPFIEAAFIDEWAEVIPRKQMKEALAHLWLLGRLFGIVMTAIDLDRYELARGSALPPSYRASRLEGRIRDLLQTCMMHGLFPRPSELDPASATDARESRRC